MESENSNSIVEKPFLFSIRTGSRKNALPPSSNPQNPTENANESRKNIIFHFPFYIFHSFRFPPEFNPLRLEYTFNYNYFKRGISL